MAGVIGVVLFREGLLARNSAEWAHIQLFRWALLPHGVTGALVLLVGPFQFSEALRRTQPLVHRSTGWVYVTVAALSALSGAYVTVVSAPGTVHVEAFFRSGLLLLSLVFALAHVRSGEFAAHRVWMIRSYCVGLTFVVSRLPDVLFHRQFPTELQHNWLWSLDIVALLFPDALLWAQRMLRRGGASSFEARTGSSKPGLAGYTAPSA